MKRNAAHLIGLCLLLVGCSNAPAASATSSDPTSIPGSSLSSETSLSSSSTFTSESPSSSEVTSSEDSSSSSTSSSSSGTPKKNGTYHFYCVNDFHGSIVEQYTGSYYEAGIAKYFGELKRLKEADPEHTIILSAGDMWQGSLESNSNYGALVTEAMNETGFDAMTVGNHEFDFGQEVLKENIAKANFPFLGGNVYRYQTDELWDSDLLGPSTTLLRGEVKIGIVGMIGQGQTSSVTSKYVSDMDFVDPEGPACNEAKRLREEEGCDIVIYVVHSAMNLARYYAADQSLFDGVFTAHTHAREKSLVNGVPFVQSYCNGEAISHIAITLDEYGARCSEYENIFSNSDMEEDAEIAAIRDAYILEPAFVEKASRVAGTVQGTLTSNETLPNLIAKGIYDTVHPLYPNVVCAMTNKSRANLYGEVSYHDVFKSTPFLNEIVLVPLSGADIVNEAGYNYVYSPDIHQYESDSYYTVAVIDYLVYHQNAYKQYDYFPSFSEERIVTELKQYPFDILFDYIHDDLNGVVNPSEYKKSNPAFNIQGV